MYAIRSYYGFCRRLQAPRFAAHSAAAVQFTPGTHPSPASESYLYLFESLKSLIATYLPADQVARVEQAYVVARDAHEGQARSSGEPYITHPVAVTRILAEMRLDHETLRNNFV